MQLETLCLQKTSLPEDEIYSQDELRAWILCASTWDVAGHTLSVGTQTVESWPVDPLSRESSVTGDRNLAHGGGKHCLVDRFICARLVVRIDALMLKNGQVHFWKSHGILQDSESRIKDNTEIPEPAPIHSSWWYVFCCFFVQWTSRITPSVGLKTASLNLPDEQNLTESNWCVAHVKNKCSKASSEQTEILCELHGKVCVIIIFFRKNKILMQTKMEKELV